MTNHIGLTDEDRNIFRRWPVEVQAKYHKADRGLYEDSATECENHHFRAMGYCPFCKKSIRQPGLYHELSLVMYPPWLRDLLRELPAQDK